MSWAVSQKPRAPRARSAKRAVPPLGGGKEVYALPPSISDDELRVILSSLPQLTAPGVVPFFVIRMSQFYRYWRLSAEPPRSETRYELRMIAHLAWKAQQPDAEHRRFRSELAATITESNRATSQLLLHYARLISGVTKQADYMFFYRDFIDCRLIQEAAAAAEAAMPGKGDYANVALSKTARVLAFVFEVAAGKPPTFSRVGVGPNSNGALRTVGGSAFAQFMLTFFRVVDPGLPETQVTSAVERELAANRAAARVDPHYYRGLSKLL